MYLEFDAQARDDFADFSVGVIPVTTTVGGDPLMAICAPGGTAIYITKAQAMEFFNLVPKE